jgi:misacylated tRNA(Ala) deacylase
MTQELFREGIAGGYLRECAAVLTRICAGDEVGDGAQSGAVVLDQTVFYPLGGGQTGDAGSLTTPYGELQIANTRKQRDTGEILHIAASGQEMLLSQLKPGDAVTARIDWPRRYRHMRFHTSTHLLCALLPYGVDGCSITADSARMDMVTTDPIDIDAVNAGLVRLVSEAHTVRTRWISDDELNANPQLVKTMSVQPPRGLGRVRLLEVEGVDLQPCGGTHVANTAEIGAVRVIKVEKKSARTRRLILGLT